MAADAIIPPLRQPPSIAGVTSVLEANKIGGQFPLFLRAEGLHLFLELSNGHSDWKLPTGCGKVNAHPTERWE